MSQVLYRKYRSKSMDELVGQEHITAALNAAIKKGQVAHAYLFTGPRGTGKTSVARILAHAVNGFTYDESATHLDIIEIDAASNRRIDEIRDLRDKVHIAPSIGKYKVYIIDEVHMLTKEAFNALLKTLEEPPSHVIFILATTDLHKVPDTIISRTQRFTFRPIEKSKIVGHLANIAKLEGISVDDEALQLIAEHADGGFRDAISMLDQTRNTSGKVTAPAVLDLLGIPSTEQIATLWGMLISDTTSAIQMIESMYSSGHTPSGIAKQLVEKAICERDIPLARKLLSIASSHDPKNELLLLTIELGGDLNTRIMPVTVPVLKELIVPKKPVKIEDKVLAQKVTKNIVVDEDQETKVDALESPNIDIVIELKDIWLKVLEKINDAGHSFYAPLRLAEAELDGDTLNLYLAFPFHIKRIKEANNLSTIVDVYRLVSGKKVDIEVHHRKPSSTETEKAATKPVKTKTDHKVTIVKKVSVEPTTDPFSAIKDVFGGAELL